MGCTSSSFLGSRESFHGKYALGEKLGQGGFGQVRVARVRGNRRAEEWQRECDRAVKIISICAKGKGRRRLPKVNPLLRKMAEREAAAWTSASGSEHCVQLHESFRDMCFYYMVMDKCRCSVLDDLESVSKGSEIGIARVFREMLLGIAHLHSRGLVHRDVKLNNFLFGGANGNTVKLCDFGLAVLLPPGSMLREDCGTSPYKAPEMLRGGGYVETVDTWSLGVVAYLILFGEFPYRPGKGDSDFEDVILRGTPAPEFRRGGECRAPSEQSTAFVRALLARSAGSRCTAAQALQLPFVMEQLEDLQDDGGVDSEEMSSLKMTIGKARQRTLEFSNLTDPTKQRSVDEILESLQGVQSFPSSNGCARAHARHFSFDFAGPRTKDQQCGPSSGKASGQRLSKGSTHDGSVSLSTYNFWDGVESLSESTNAQASDEDALDEIEEVETPGSPFSEAPSWQDMPNVIAA